MDGQRVLEMAVDVGFQLVKSGAEIYRVEQTITYICRAYGLREVNIYAIPSSIIATADADGTACNITRRIRKREINLDRMDKLNSLSRWICAEKPEPQQALEKLQDIVRRPGHPAWLVLLAEAGIGFLFTLFFGGSLLDALVATPIATLIWLAMLGGEKTGGNFIFLNIIGGFVAALSARAAGIVFPALHPDLIIIGDLMTLVPGIAVTNGMRDLIGGDFMAALNRFIEAGLVATGIALGVAGAMMLIR